MVFDKFDKFLLLFPILSELEMAVSKWPVKFFHSINIIERIL
jgi:hypothetical protein